MISQTANYALRAVAVLAQRGSPMLVAQLARETCVPPAYLSKILQTLGRRGYVRAKRGIRGGFRLAKKPSKITLLQIVSEFDAWPRVNGCLIRLDTAVADLCPLHKRLDQVAAFVEQALGSTTIADVLSDSDKHTPLCPVDPASPLGSD